MNLPILDDRTHADLVRDARALIPTLAPAWTDHNPSDPGIVLVELLAWLAEIVLYRIDRIPERSYRTFLDLLRGPQANDPIDALPLDDAIRTTVADLRERHRAITPDDFEFLALRRWPTLPAAIALGTAGIVRRALCIAEQSPTSLPNRWKSPPAIDEGHVTLVVVPETSTIASGLVNGLTALLDEWRLLTTRVHVVGYAALHVKVSAKLYLRSDADVAAVQVAAPAALAQLLDPRTGWRGAGWPFGRPIYNFDAQGVLDAIAGVDFVADVQVALVDPAQAAAVGVTRPPAPKDDHNVAIGVALQPNELPSFDTATLTLFQLVGTQWQAL